MTSRLRRHVLQGLIGSAAAAALPLAPSRPAFARAPRNVVSATELGDGLLLLTGAGANVVAARGPDGLMLVDGGLQERSAELVGTALEQWSARRVHTLFNTHWHPEQTGSNVRLGKAGTRIIAHENTRLWLGREITVSWRDAAYGPLPEQARPDDTIYTNAELSFGDESVEYGYLPQAHTDGDIYVFLRKANLLVTGGVVSGDGWPIVDWQTGGWIGGLVGGLDKLIAVADENTRVLPASGPLLTRTDLESQRRMYFTIYERLVKALTSGLGPQEALETKPAEGLNPHWGDPQPFLLMAFQSLWGHFAPDA